MENSRQIESVSEFEICFRTKRVARAPFLIGVDSRAGRVEDWRYSFQIGLW